MPQPRRLRPLSWTGWLAAFALLVVALLGACEALGWRFLREPAERLLADQLQREVRLDGEWRLHLLGPLRLSGGHVVLGAPAWSRSAHLLDADDLHLTLGWRDLWRARDGQPLRIRALTAQRLDLQLERLADGRASWHFGPPRSTPAATPARDFDIDHLALRQGQLAYHDAVLQMHLTGSASLDPGLRLQARGDYRGQPLSLDLAAAQPLPLLTAAADTPPVPLTLRLQARGATLAFDGQAVDALRLRALQGRYQLRGTSLADAGEVLGLTLPATGPFDVRGRVRQQDRVWTTEVEAARIGDSRLRGQFSYDPGAAGATPLLRGTLQGERLLLADLAPAVGVPAAPAPAPAPSSQQGQAQAAPARTKALPDARFNLPALRNMNADLRVDLASLDLGRYFSAPLQPFKAHLTLTGGVLGLADIDARTAKGSLAGQMGLDARQADVAAWSADLRWRDVRLEQWLAVGRGRETPYVSGRFDGQAQVRGQGRSTAEILGSLEGHLRGQLRDGALSHVVTEVVGLDLAQAIGVWLRGDDPLKLGCAQAQVQFKDGVATPQVLVLDSPDTTIWINGQVSLKQETLDLHVQAAPKDISPLSLRSPVDIGGTLLAPQVSVQRKPLLQRLLPAAALALVQPLAALIPLVDTGDAAAAAGPAAACARLVRQPVTTPPRPAARPPER